MKKTAKWTVKEITEAVNGVLNHEKFADVQVFSVHFDTRLLKPGALFVPLKAERDGHDFVNQAIDHQAAAVFWEAQKKGAPADFPVIYVSNPADAMVRLAQYYLKQIRPKVVAITGSNGKTTTKDLTASVLSQRFNVYKTQENLNNQIGVPLTILDMPLHTEALVLEMGMDRPGEIEQLSLLFHPHIGVVTMIGESHLEFFGTRENIAKNKMGIVKGILPGGRLLYSGDEPLLKKIAQEVPSTISLQTFGFSKGANFSADQVNESIHETTFYVNESPDQVEWKIPIPGRHNVTNALAAVGVGRSLGLSWSKIRKGLAEAQLTKNRLEWMKGWNDSVLLNDAYNASPTSMIAALHYFAHLKGDHRKIIVIGDMLELGEKSQQMHADLQTTVDFSIFDEVYLYGKEMFALKKSLETAIPNLSLKYYKENKKLLIDDLKKELTSEDWVLFKSSFGTGLLSVVEALKNNQDVSL